MADKSEASVRGARMVMVTVRKARRKADAFRLTKTDALAVAQALTEAADG